MGAHRARDVFDIKREARAVGYAPLDEPEAVSSTGKRLELYE